MDELSYDTLIPLLKRDDELSDVIFEIGIRGEKFSGHQLLFALTSDFWKKLFYPEHDTNNHPTKVVKLSNVSVNGFKLLLDYVYTHQVNLTNRNALSIYNLSLFFQMKTLQNICKEYISKNLTLNSAIQLFNQNPIPIKPEYANQNLTKQEFSDEKYVTEFLYILNHFNDLIKKANCFNELKKETIKHFLVHRKKKKLRIELLLFRRLSERVKYHHFLKGDQPELSSVKFVTDNSNENNMNNNNLYGNDNDNKNFDDNQELFDLINYDLMDSESLLEVFYSNLIPSNKIFNKMFRIVSLKEKNLNFSLGKDRNTFFTNPKKL
ncbi:kelch-like protein [Anaeramoeba flamelloides]|uniref:Kelch-like protein n=1 Tax=Anaeramoeba flamelloides TaxID=1746091 RepID=A0ABQ8XAB9_9EUKA|nr:kelch-like protein [Anaeramoeba flamelloides]